MRLVCTILLLITLHHAMADTPFGFEKLVWNSPSKNSYGSMPIGNGDIGLNVWVEQNGDLLFYLSKTDAWSENCRLLKLGKVRVSLSPTPFGKGVRFSQTLNVKTGTIVVTGEGKGHKVVLTVAVDANHPVVDIDIDSDKQVEAKVALEHWRTKRRQLKGQETHSAYGLHGKGGKPIFVEPDTIVKGSMGRIVWYHRNERSIWKANLNLQALNGFAEKQTDPLLNRTFGALIKGDGLVNHSDTVLKSEKAAKSIRVSVFPHTAQTEDIGAWLKQVEANSTRIARLSRETRTEAHRSWWKAYWERSYIHISTDNGRDKRVVENINRGYVLQRFVNACAGRGAFPIKFNGSLFTTEGNDKGRWNADYRRWGGPYWWQNTRLPYWSMLESGDFDLMRPLFKMYRDNLEIRKAATRKYYNHEGAYFVETQYFWGTYVDGNYGRDRSKRPDGLTENSFIRYYWQSGLEFSLMMLDYYAFTQDETFAKETLLPIASEVITFYDQHWKRDKAGKILFDPAMSLETWHKAVNPLPEIVGITKVCNELMAMPKGLTTAEQRKQWQRLVTELPVVPTGTHKGKRILKPAHSYSHSCNTENPELYAIFPYRAYGIGKADLEIARNTFAIRRFKGTKGWYQNAIQAAYLGLSAEAAKLTGQNFSTWSRAHRFPAMWGPNFDWIPDQDHGSVAMIALQRMILQYDEDKLHLFPAWPKHWDVTFKLHAPGKTILTGCYENGRLKSLKTFPEERKAGLVIHDTK